MFDDHPREWRCAAASRRRLAPVGQRLDGAFEVHGVPKNDGGDYEVEPARAIALVLEAAIANFAKPVEKDGPRQGVFGLGFVEPGMNAPRRSSTFCSQSKVKGMRAIWPISQRHGEAILPPDSC